MKKHNPNNERIKRKYFTFLKEAKQQNEASIDGVAKAFNRFEVYTKFKDFKSFHHQQAVAFKKHMAEQKNLKTGKPLSKATLNTTMGHLKRFFQWLAGQPGYKSRIQYSEAEYFNLSEKETRIATARRNKPVPTIDQIEHVIFNMPHKSEIERRNQAIIAFTLLTGARDSAIASCRLKHVDLSAGTLFQDARDVKTKFSKTFTTYFFPVGGKVRKVVEDWVTYLKEEKLWGNEDPLFPSTNICIGSTGHFEAVGVKKELWKTASPIRAIFKEAFTQVGLPYFNPHSFRNTLVQLGEKVCSTPETFKAWSQNLGHEKVLTTFACYGEVPQHRQGELINDLANNSKDNEQGIAEMLKSLTQEVHELKTGGQKTGGQN